MLLFSPPIYLLGGTPRDDHTHTGGGGGTLPLAARTAWHVMIRGDLKLKISDMESDKEAKAATVNLPALALYRKREEEYHVRVQELEEATVARKEARE